MITGKMYDYLKFLAQILLPALGTLYFALAGIWGLPSAQEVVGTVLAVDTCLGVILGISQVSYAKTNATIGELEVLHQADGVQNFNLKLDLDTDPEQIVKQNEVKLKVTRPRKSSKARAKSVSRGK